MEGIMQWEAALGHPVTSLDFSPEGDAIITGDRAGGVTVFDRQGSVRWRKRLPRTVRSVAISSHGQFSLTGSDDGLVRFFDRTGGVKWQLEVNGRPACVNVSEDGTTVMVGTSNCVLTRLDRCGETVWWYDAHLHRVQGWFEKLADKVRPKGEMNEKSIDHPLTSTDITWDARFLAATTTDGSTFFFDSWGTCHWRHCYKWKYTHVSISDDGCHVIAGTNARKIVHISNNMETAGALYGSAGEIIPRQEWAVEIDRDITSVKLSNSGEFIAVGSRDGELMLLGQQAETFWTTQIGQPIRDVGISGQGEYVTVITESGLLRMYRVVSGQAVSEDFMEFAVEVPASSQQPPPAAGASAGRGPLEFMDDSLGYPSLGKPPHLVAGMATTAGGSAAVPSAEVPAAAGPSAVVPSAAAAGAGGLEFFDGSDPQKKLHPDQAVPATEDKRMESEAAQPADIKPGPCVADSSPPESCGSLEFIRDTAPHAGAESPASVATDSGYLDLADIGRGTHAASVQAVDEPPLSPQPPVRPASENDILDLLEGAPAALEGAQPVPDRAQTVPEGAQTATHPAGQDETAAGSLDLSVQESHDAPRDDFIDPDMPRELWRCRIADVLMPFSRGCLAMSPDGSRIAAYPGAGAVTILDGQGRISGSFNPAESRPAGMCTSKDLSRLFVASPSYLFGVNNDGGLKWKQPLTVAECHCSSSGSRIAVATPDGRFQVFSHDGKEVYRYVSDMGITAVHVTEDDSAAVFAGPRELRYITLKSSREEKVPISGAPKFITSFPWNEVVWVGGDGIYSWQPGSDSSTVKRLVELSAHCTAAASAAGRLVVGTAARNALLVFPGTSKESVVVPLKSAPSAAVVSADGAWAAVGTRYRFLSLIPFDHAADSVYLKPKDRVEAVALSGDARVLCFIVRSEVIVWATGLTAAC